MGTLQTELERTIAEWDKQDEVLTLEVTEQPIKHSTFRETVGSSRATFDAVVANPGMTKSQIVAKLEAAGHKRQSTSSLISAYLRTGIFVRRNGDAIFSTTSTYVSSAKGLNAARAAIKAPRRAAKKVATAPIQDEQTGLKLPPTKLTAEYVLDNISFGEGVKLFETLTRAFRG